MTCHLNRPRLMLFLGMLIASATCLYAVDDGPSARATLKGIKAIVVLVEQFDASAINDGLTMESVQTDVELRLRKGGVKVLQQPSLQDALRASNSEAFSAPVLYININTAKGREPLDDLYAVNILITVHQHVKVKSNGASATADTWGTGIIFMVPRSSMSSATQLVLADIVDEFINAYVSVNPK